MTGDIGQQWNFLNITVPYSGSDQPWNLWNVTYECTGTTLDTRGAVAQYSQCLRTGSQPAQLWGGVDEMHDLTGNDLGPHEAQQGREIDISGNGTVDPLGTRRALGLFLFKALPNGAPVVASEMLCIDGPPAADGYAIDGIRFGGITIEQAAIDTRITNLMPGGYVLWMKRGHAIAFDERGDCAISENDNGQLEVLGDMMLTAPITLGRYGAGHPIPAPTASLCGALAVVTDAVNVAYGVPYVPGGSAVKLVLCDGTKWLIN